MSDNARRRDTASTDLPHPARHPYRARYEHRAALYPVPRPERRPPAARGQTWPDARTAERLLDGGTATAPPTVPADRLVRLLSAAREVGPALDPAREAAALAAFRSAVAGRAATEAPRAGRLAALRAAFAVRRPRVMAAAVVSALALGGVVVGMAAAARSLTPGGAGTSPLETRPPAAVSPDGGRQGSWPAAPATRSPAPRATGTPQRGHPGADRTVRRCRGAADQCRTGSRTGRDTRSRGSGQGGSGSGNGGSSNGGNGGDQGQDQGGRDGAAGGDGWNSWGERTGSPGLYSTYGLYGAPDYGPDTAAGYAAGEPYAVERPDQGDRAGRPPGSAGSRTTRPGHRSPSRPPGR
ncbi:hypothetical protein [Streptomyces sp. NPDC020983]|uniref:hypothetical protein n=1 Tax=Streptomyces sp. NPDC020983 TaxID=3365106 RepID=UPI0037A2A311